MGGDEGMAGNGSRERSRTGNEEEWRNGGTGNNGTGERGGAEKRRNGVMG